MLNAPARSGLKAAALWIIVELAIRAGLVLAVVVALLLAGALDEEWMERTFIGHAQAWSLWLAAIVLGWLFWRLVRKHGLTPAELGYRLDLRLLLVAIAAGLALAAVAYGLGVLAERVTPGLAAQAEELRQYMRWAGPVAMAGLLIANSILGPAAEELAWRGYIQHRLVAAWGSRSGLTSTALVFVAKHAMVDQSLIRLPILVVLGLALGLLRLRWGTGVSTIAHVTLNAVATFFALYSD
ncbi:MAG: CPBP family glutamic-type intramembrane protease [bacterium]